MFWLILHLICILNVKGQMFEAKKVYFLEIKFWDNGPKQIKTTKGFLSKVSTSIEDEEECLKEVEYYLNTCNLLKLTNHGYVLIDDEISRNMTSNYTNQVNKRFLKFEFLFTEDFMEDHLSFEKYVGNKQIYTAYEILKNGSETKNSISNYDEIDIHMLNIKERIVGFISMGPLTFDIFNTILDGKRFKKELGRVEELFKFDLCYFKNHLECIESIKEFIKYLRHINLIKEGDTLKQNKSFETGFSLIPVEETPDIKVSEFMIRLHEKFINHLNHLNFSVPESNIVNEISEVLFMQCCDHIKDLILNNCLFLPIGGKYDVEYYFKELHDLIYNIVVKIQKKYNFEDLEEKDSMVRDMFKMLIFDLKKLQKIPVKDLCESDYIPNHFSKLIGKEVVTLDDYINIEKIVCDFQNMFIYIVTLIFKAEDPSCDISPYFYPISTENFNYRIVDGIVIKNKGPAKFACLRAFDNNERNVYLEEGVDYFVNGNSCFYFIPEILKLKNIKEIEIISVLPFYNLISEKFRLKDF